MEQKEALKITHNLIEVISTLEHDAKLKDYAIQEMNTLKIKYDLLKKENETFKRWKFYYDKLASNSDIQICVQCDGKGEMYIDMGEFGCEGIECSECEGSGIINKKTV